MLIDRQCVAVMVVAGFLLAASGGAVRAETGVADRVDPRPPPAPCTIIEPPGDGNYVTNLWTNGIVPYVFHGNVSSLNQSRTLDAMANIEAVANVRFVPWTGQTNRIIVRDSTGNNSSVGMIGGTQTINMVSWEWEFIIVHELLHALGTWHEHQRPDRDDFIEVNYDNIEPQFAFAFDIRLGTLTGPYDFDSVMHYGQCAFSLCCPSVSCRSITVLPPNQSWQTQIGQRDHLSEGDIAGLVAMYGPPCPMDLDGSGDIGFGDILQVLSAWGACFGCPEDVSGNSVVNFGDVLLLIAEWGACK